MPSGSRPHHVHASVGGNLVAFGLYGTDMVAVVDTHSDTLLGPWDSNPDTTDARVHAGVFSKDGNALYLASDATSEVIALDPRTGDVLWRMPVPGAHELAVTHDGKTAYVSCRTLGKVSVIDLETRSIRGEIALSVPDTLQLSANEKLLTVGLRTPGTGAMAQVAVVDTGTMDVDIVTIGGVGTIAGHQWTSPNGQYTFAAFEGPGAGVAVIDHTAAQRRHRHVAVWRPAPWSRLRAPVARSKGASLVLMWGSPSRSTQDLRPHDGGPRSERQPLPIARTRARARGPSICGSGIVDAKTLEGDGEARP